MKGGEGKVGYGHVLQYLALLFWDSCQMVGIR